MKQQEIDQKFVPVDVEPDLPSDEGKPGTEFEQGVLQPVHQSLLDDAFRGRISQVKEIEDVGVLEQMQS